MNKIKNLLIMGVLGFIFIPNVNAASISIGASEASDNTVKVPITLTVDEDDQFNQIKLGCETDNDSVSCMIEAVEGNGTASQTSGNETLFVGNFTSGQIKLCNVVLTNNSDAKQSNVSLTVTNIETLNNGTSVEKIESKSKNGFQIKVKESNESAKTSSDATLSSVVFSQGTMSPSFSKSENKYVIYGISDTINSIKLNEYTCNDGTQCYVSIEGGESVSSKTIYLARGENTVKLNVTSSDGTKKNTYTFTVYRGETAYNSSKLSSLSFGDYVLTPAFSKDTYEYTMSVPSTVNSVDAIMKYTFEDTSLTSSNLKKDGTDNLVEGENTIVLKVTNASGEESSTYTIKLTRESDAAITILTYKDGKITFYDSSNEQKEMTEEEFKTAYPDEWSKIVNKEYKFDEEGKLIVEDDTTETTEKKKSSKLWLIIILVVVGIAIIVVAGIFIFKKKPDDKNKKGPKGKKEENPEEGIEEQIVEEENKEDVKEEDKTVDIDEALSDLLDTKQYNFDDEEK